MHKKVYLIEFHKVVINGIADRVIYCPLFIIIKVKNKQKELNGPLFRLENIANR